MPRTDGGGSRRLTERPNFVAAMQRGRAWVGYLDCEMTLGAYPFGARLRRVVQIDRTPKRVFVLGVYASAVHARWLDADGRELVRALAIASEPCIFWDGTGVDAIVSAIPVPAGAGSLVPADAGHNGPSGRSLDQHFLQPLGVDRASAWLCDLVPYTCLNDKQAAAIARAYEPRREAFGLPAVALPPVPRVFADERRCAEILDEIRAAQPEVLVVLGDQPLKHFVSRFERRWRKLSSFGEYGRLHATRLDDVPVSLLPLAHPRQVAALGRHSPRWRGAHQAWLRDVAPALLGR